MFRLNKTIKYSPNRGQWIQKLKTSDIIAPHIVVTSKGLGFKTNLPNIFTAYVIKTAPEKLALRWQDKAKQLQFYMNCLHFAVFCATSGLGIALEHFKARQPLVSSIIRFHLYYHVRKILYHLKIKLPYEKSFDAYETNFDKEAYLELCTDYGVNSAFDFRNQYIFSTYQGSTLEYLDGDSWGRWIMPKSQGLTKQGVEMLSESIRVYVYCLLTAQSSTRSNIIGNTAPNFEAQKLFAKEVEDFVKRDMLLHEDIRRYESILSNARSPVDFSFGVGIYMLPSDLQLKVARKQNFSDKLKVGKSDQAGKIDLKSLATPISYYEGKAVSARAAQAPNAIKMTLHEQRLSKEHQEELQSLVLLGSFGIVGIIYFLKTR